MAASDSHTTDEGEPVMDEDVFETYMETKRLKKRYQETSDEHRSVSRDITHLTRLVNECRTRLFMEFRGWYEALGGNVTKLDAISTDEQVDVVPLTRPGTAWATPNVTLTTTALPSLSDDTPEDLYMSTLAKSIQRAPTFDKKRRLSSAMTLSVPGSAKPK